MFEVLIRMLSKSVQAILSISKKNITGLPALANAIGVREDNKLQQ